MFLLLSIKKIFGKVPFIRFQNTIYHFYINREENNLYEVTICLIIKEFTKHIDKRLELVLDKIVNQQVFGSNKLRNTNWKIVLIFLLYIIFG